MDRDTEIQKNSFALLIDSLLNMNVVRDDKRQSSWKN
jgi:hypothetical protein